jgi:hypothetical protein
MLAEEGKKTKMQLGCGLRNGVIFLFLQSILKLNL